MGKLGHGAMVMLAAGLLTTLTFAASADKPKYSIEEIMKKAHAGRNNLPAKLMSGKITDEEKTKLIEYYEELGKNKPPRGDAADWKKRTDDLVAAAKAAVNGGPAEMAKFKKAVNCTACHNLHKAADE